MRKGYCLAVLSLLIISSMAMIASASQTDRWSSSGYYSAFGNENRQESNQLDQTQNQVTLILYVLDGGLKGKALPGVDVTAYDKAGISFRGITDSKGSVVLSGQPGTWQLILAKEGYKTSNLRYDFTKSQVGATYLQKIPESAPSQPTAETAAYPQGIAIPAKEIELTAPTALTAQPEPVSLKIDVYETDLNGTALSGVRVTGRDSAGNNFGGMTDLYGSVVLTGLPGTWQFSFAKDGYEPLNLNYSVTETEEVAAYLERAAQPAAQSTMQIAPQSQGQIDFTVYVHEGSLNGTALSGVQIAGQDDAGNRFEGVTDSDGAAVLSGQPGTWQFSFTKEGYGTLNLSYNVTEADYGDVYLQSSDQSAQSQVSEIVTSQGYQQS